MDSKLIGTTLGGRFELVEFLAEGGMGAVFRAIQHPLQREVAIKVLSPDRARAEGFREQFFLEACHCARLSHPNIVSIYDYGVHDESIYFIAMEYLRGETLLALMKRVGPLPARAVVAVLKQVCLGLNEAHRAGLVHRDLKPSNLFIADLNSGGQVLKILDFGLVKDLDGNSTTHGPEFTVGSPMFMAPEQIRNHPVDPRTDIYALGTVATVLLAGRSPFPGSSRLGTLLSHLETPLPSVAELNPSAQIPDALQAHISRAVEKEPSQRFPDVTSFLNALLECESTLPPVEGLPGPVQLADAYLAMTSTGTAIGGGSSDDASDAITSEDSQALWETATIDCQVLPMPEPGHSTEQGFRERINIDALKRVDLSRYTAFIDINCPFCFALHERISRWGCRDALNWALVEHASHILDGPFDVAQEEILASEVFSLHHRAPDIEVKLPPWRCHSLPANHLLVAAARQFPDKVGELRTNIYRALWQDGRNIGDRDVLEEILGKSNLPASLLTIESHDTSTLEDWQSQWENADYDTRIPVISEQDSERVLIGLANEDTLFEFLTGQRSTTIDNAVCYYQRRPVVLVCGSLASIWPVLDGVRGDCEIVHAGDASKASGHLIKQSQPDILLIEDAFLHREERDQLTDLARRRNIPWILVAEGATYDAEVEALRGGAAEFLTTDGDTRIAEFRFRRVLNNYLRTGQKSAQITHDALTGLPSRRSFNERLETAWREARTDGSTLAMALIDIDHFKVFNERYGYLEGDRILMTIATEIRDAVDQPDNLVARFSGAHFAVLMPDTGGSSACAMATTIKENLIKASIPHESSPKAKHLTVSVGLCVASPTASGHPHDLVVAAGQALRQAQEVGEEHLIEI